MTSNNLTWTQGPFAKIDPEKVAASILRLALSLGALGPEESVSLSTESVIELLNRIEKALQSLILAHEDVATDHKRLVRELDVALNQDGASKQASLCDIVAQVKREGLKSRWWHRNYSELEAEMDRTVLMRSILRSGQDAGIIRKDMESVSVSQCIFILQELSKGPSSSKERV